MQSKIMSTGADVLERDYSFGEDLFPIDRCWFIGNRRRRRDYPHTCALVSCIHEMFTNFEFPINIPATESPTETAPFLTEGNRRSGKINISKVKMHLTAEKLNDMDSRISYYEEINEK